VKITNKYNLPDSIVQAVTNDPYDSGSSDITATTLLKPPQMVALEKIHGNEIENDAVDRIWSLLGQSVHHILDRADNGNVITEARFFTYVNGWKVSGQIDRLEMNHGEYQYPII
jgi:hypothetical protein